MQSMKKLLLSLMLSAAAMQLHAEGYQINSLSSKQQGMAHTGTAMKLGSESVYFNPAALSFQRSAFDLSLGTTLIMPKAEYRSSYYDYDDPASVVAKAERNVSTPLFAYAGWRATENLGVGIGFYTPYGSSLDWGDSWAGAHLIQDINLAAYTVQPTLSYKICDRVSFGAGLMITWGKFDLSRSFFPVGASTNGAIAALLQSAGMGQYADAVMAVGDEPLVSARLGGKSQVAVGVNLGFMWNITDKWTFGVTYRSKQMMKVKSGDAELRYANDVVKQILAATGRIPKMDEGTFRTELPLPWNVTFGLSFRPTERWELGVDIQWVGWSSYKDLNVSFNETDLGIADIYSVKNYSNTIITRFGAQYALRDWATLRAGIYVDESPVRSDYFNPETPSMTKLTYTCGVSLRPTRCLSIDLAYNYVSSADPERTGSVPFLNNLTGKQEYFSGNYKVSANVLSIGVALSF